MILTLIIFREICWESTHQAEEGRHDGDPTGGDRTSQGEATRPRAEEEPTQAVLDMYVHAPCPVAGDAENWRFVYDPDDDMIVSNYFCEACYCVVAAGII